MSRRQQILRAAARLLKHYGFAKTAVSDIARQAGVGVGTIYLEFDSKEALVAELSLGLHGALLERMEAAARAGGRRSATQRLQAVLQERVAGLRALAADGEHGADLLGGALGRCCCRAVERAHADFRERELRLLATLLQEGVRVGELSCDDPEHTARTIASIYEVFDGPIERLHRLIFNGLIRRRTP